MKKQLEILTPEVKQGIIITIAVLAVVVIFFWLTAIRVNRPYTISVPFVSYQQEIQFDEILMGSILNRTEDKYFVFVRDADFVGNMAYEQLVSMNEGNYRYYTVDLNNIFNREYQAEENNFDQNNLQFKTSTILVIENGEIIEFLADKDAVFAYFIN